MTDQVPSLEADSNSTVPTWASLGLSTQTLELLEQAGFKSPTPVQAASVPIALEGHDLMASAQTGTGKTASFVLPLIERIRGREGTLGLILAPTREIAQQIQAVFEKFGTPQKVRSVVLIGGVDMKLDAQALASYPQVIVATPGRLCDHLDRGNLWLDFIQCVVLDEVDRMLDMGFSTQLNRIMDDVPDSAQTLVFSATISPVVQKLTQKILNQPKVIQIGNRSAAAHTVEQRILWMHEESKGQQLRRLIAEEKGTIIVFVRSKDAASRLFRSLHSRGYSDVSVIHSDLRQMDREQALIDFKEGKSRILIATDIAGRGIHIDSIAHVVNYDLPREPEDYVHRVGRTGRSDASGRATSFATTRDQLSVKEIQKLIRTQIPFEFADPIELGSRGHSRGGRSKRGSSPSGSSHSAGRSRFSQKKPRKK